MEKAQDPSNISDCVDLSEIPLKGSLQQPGRDGATTQPWRFCGAWKLSLRLGKNPFTWYSKSTWKHGVFSLLLRWFKSILTLIQWNFLKPNSDCLWCKSLLFALLSPVSCANAIIPISAFFQALKPLSYHSSSSEWLFLHTADDWAR